MAELITSFARSAELAALLAPCRENYGVGDPGRYEWPNNVLSARTVAFEDGRIARSAEPVARRVDPAELELCRRLSAEAATLMEGVLVGVGGSSDDDAWAPFFQVADVDGAPPERIDDAWLRERFGGTICPLTSVLIEPLAESGTYWETLTGDEDEYDGAFDEDDEDNDDEGATLAVARDRWRQLIAFFEGRPELGDPYFASIGTEDDESAAPAEKPDGFEIRGSVLPRLPFALTAQGSVVGLFGHVVWT